MFILFKIWSNKKFWIFFVVFVIVGATTGGIFGYLDSKGCFYRKAIGYKYCYFISKYDLTEKFQQSMYSNNESKALIIKEYYNKLSNPLKACDTLVFYGDNFDGYIPKFLKVDVMKYLADSIVKIRAEWTLNHKPFYHRFTCYVPVISLHDTIPLLPKAIK